MSTDGPRPHGSPGALLGLLILAAALRLPVLGRSSLWWDECATVEAARWLGESAQHVARGMAAGLSSYFLILAPWVTEDTPEWLLRLPSALTGIALVAVAWWLARSLDGRIGSPALLALLVAASPFLVWHAREARWYALTWLLTGLSAVAFVRALRGGSVTAVIACLVLGLAAASTFPPAAALVGLQALWIAALRVRVRSLAAADGVVADSRRLRTWHWALAAVLVIGAAWGWMVLGRPAFRAGSAGFVFSNVGGGLPIRAGGTIVAAAAGYTLGPGPSEWHHDLIRSTGVIEGGLLLAAVLALVSLVALGVRAFVRAGEGPLAGAFLSLSILYPAAVLLACAWTGHRYAPRHAGASLIYVMALVAAGGRVAAGRSGWRSVWPGPALVAVLLLLQSGSVWNLFASPRYLREEVRPAAREVANSAGSDDLVLVLGGIDLPWRHYYRGRAPWRAIYPDTGDEGWSEEVQRTLAPGASLYIVRGRVLTIPGEERFLEAVEATTAVVEARGFPGVEVERRLPIRRR